MQKKHANYKNKFDVVIIGGGVIGALTAFRLSKYSIRVCLIEREMDLACGATGANSSIVHAGHDPIPFTNKAKYNILGSKMMPELCNQLGVPYKRNGALVIAFTPEEDAILRLLLARGKENGVDHLEMLSSAEVRNKEPNLSKAVISALYLADSGIVCPYELTFAGAEVASQNGVEFLFEHQVTAIDPMVTNSKESRFLITCTTPYSKTPVTVNTQTIVNAAGLYSDQISSMAGDSSFSIIPRRGEYIILDRSLEGMIHHTIFQTPGAQGKGVLVTPTVDGNILIGPNSRMTEDPDDTATSKDGLDEIRLKGLKSLPDMDLSKMIRSFAGVRASSSTEDFIIGESKQIQGLFQAAGIESPGLSAAPAIAEEIKRVVLASFMDKIPEKKNYTNHRVPPVRFRDLPLHEQEKLIKKDKKYANVLCRCEGITEAEILESIRRPVGARSLNGIKMRTRAGMGRCQGGFCVPRILPVLAEELSVPMEKITLNGLGSEVLKGKKR